MMQKPKILAADNTKMALRYMETILGDIYDVTLVQTGMSVLDCLKSEIPDLILMNANMFGMDGYEVLRRIKEDKETKEIPVILMMNEKDTQSELRGLEEGAIDFISLPFEPQVLKARIAHIVELSVLRKQQAHLIAKQKSRLTGCFCSRWLRLLTRWMPKTVMQGDIRCALRSTAGALLQNSVIRIKKKKHFIILRFYTTLVRCLRRILF